MLLSNCTGNPTMARGRACEAALREVGLGISPRSVESVCIDHAPVPKASTSPPALSSAGTLWCAWGLHGNIVAPLTPWSPTAPKWRTHLVAAYIPLGERVRASQTYVGLVWEAHLWAPSRSPLDAGEAAEFRRLHRMTHCPKRSLRIGYPIISAGAPALSMRARWALLVVHGRGSVPPSTPGGHTHRHPESPAFDAVHWRGPRCWRAAHALQATGAARQLAMLG